MSVHVQPSSSRAAHKTDPSCSPAGIPTCLASQEPRHNCQEPREELRHAQLRESWIQPHAARPALRETSSFASPHNQHDKLWLDATTSARQAVRHVHLQTTTRSYDHWPPQETTTKTVAATIRQHHDMSSVPRSRQTSHEGSLKLLPTKHVCTWHIRALLNQSKGHAKVLVRRETGLMKMWQVECLLVSCIFQWCSSCQYVHMCQLVSVPASDEFS